MCLALFSTKSQFQSANKLGVLSGSNLYYRSLLLVFDLNAKQRSCEDNLALYSTQSQFQSANKLWLLIQCSVRVKFVLFIAPSRLRLERYKAKLLRSEYTITKEQSCQLNIIEYHILLTIPNTIVEIIALGIIAD